ncbi:glycine--tRNA ligase [Candidatus Micrarchaeota archaeon]|nr:glycine--tRNA ligase [Candidatus Micrarchaeota archaeon]
MPELENDLMNLALRRSLFYPSAEVYPNAPSGFWEFAMEGAAIRRNIASMWRRELVRAEGMVEISGAQILPEIAFEASGHLANFNDPLTQCEKCHALWRVDTMLGEHMNINFPEGMSENKFDDLIKKHKLKCKKCGGELGETKRFNLMMGMDIGATGNQKGYLRPETAQNIFLDFARINRSGRVNLPFGIAQAGQSFRNEIAPRNSLLRAREFGQMECEIFFNPNKINEIARFDEVKNYKLNLLLLKGNAGGKENVTKISCAQAVKNKIVSGKLIAYYLARTQQLYETFGLPAKLMRFRELGDDERAFYAKETWDFEVQTPNNWVELVACNYRTDYDLKSHGDKSKKEIAVNEDGAKFIPHVFELSAGLDRTLFVVLSVLMKKEKRGPEERIYLDIPARIAPYRCAIFPLVKKDGLAEKAQEIYMELNNYGFDVLFDEKGSIGKRYARVDEVGVPFAITVDYEAMKGKTKGTVTLRERNSMKQRRVKIKELPQIMWKIP